jgi:hypothetical protein
VRRGELPLKTLRQRAAAVVVTVLAVGVVFLYDPGPGPRTPPARGCAAALVVGLRGNGDGFDAGHGLGDDSWAVAGRLAARLDGRLDATSIGFPYATGPGQQIVAHVDAASKALGAYLRARQRRCPAERLVLIGQSEGAAVVHLALPSIGGQLAGAVLLADPARLAASPYDVIRSTHDGILARVLLGRWTGLLGTPRDVVPASMTARVRSYCLPTDPVCDPSPATELQGVFGGVHTSYRDNPDGVADMAAGFAAARLLQGAF